MRRGFFSYLLFVLLTVSCTGFYSCKKTFEYSPYSGDVSKNYKDNTTAINIEKIKKIDADATSSFKIAILSDTHNYHDQLIDAINNINTDNEVKFVVICGDMSDQGLQKEYEIFYEMLKKLQKPVLTVIGNHDYLANAESMYADMFGANNYSVYFGKYTFIFFDNVFWEKNGTPDFNWLNDEASTSVTKGQQPILISHIPPFGDQYDDDSRRRHEKVVNDNNIILSIHGHTHAYSYGNVVAESESDKYVVAPTVGDRMYCTVKFDNTKESRPEVTLVKF